MRGIIVGYANLVDISHLKTFNESHNDVGEEFARLSPDHDPLYDRKYENALKG